MKRNILSFLLLVSASLSAQQQMQVKVNDYTSITDGITKQRPREITTELLHFTPEQYYNHPDLGKAPINAPDEAFELIHKRTLNERVYYKKNSDGSIYYRQKAYGNINYVDDSGFIRDIDFTLRPEERSGVYSAMQQPLPTLVDIPNTYTSIRIKELEFRYNSNLKMFYETANGSTTTPEAARWNEHTAGADGVWIFDMFQSVDAEMAFRQNAIKTNFILKNKESIPADAKYLIIDDMIELPEGFSLKMDDPDGYFLGNGDWKGDLVLESAFGLRMLRIERPVVLDQQKGKTHSREQVDAIGYQLLETAGGIILRIRINAEWLRAAERKYPVVIDPTLIGEATYTAGDMGFEFDNTCWSETDYCNFSMDITVPGKTTLTAAYFDATYYSQNFGCFFVTDCLMSEAAFRILGICDDSPGPSSFWTCLPPVGDSAGTCYGVDLDMFNTIACVPPQCADYEFTFEMRTYHCSCTQPPCGILCHYIPSGGWVITIEGKTVEENPIQSATFPDFVICAGDSIDLYASGIWGVPPYVYEWLPGGDVEPVHWVAPATTTTYTSVIHDVCDMTDTVSQTVTVNQLPVVDIGPFEGCYSTTLEAPPGYEFYVWYNEEDSVLAYNALTLTVDSTGIYYLEVTDGNGCTGLSEPIEAYVYEAPIINAIPDTVFVTDGALALLEAEVIVGGDVNFSWTPAIDVNCPTCPVTLAFSVGEENTFYVTGEEHGCVSAPDSIVVIMTESELIIPNAFTPNEDGLNDVFSILNPIYYPVFSFEIYNRWGQQVFATSDVTRGWDGTYDTKTQEIGMYIWVVTYEKANEPGKKFILRGTVTLLR